MSDYGELCHDLREEYKERRDKRYVKNLEAFKLLGIPHEVKNNATQFIIRVKEGKPISFYPSSCMWVQPRSTGKPAKGWSLESLVGRIKFSGGLL